MDSQIDLIYTHDKSQIHFWNTNNEGATITLTDDYNINGFPEGVEIVFPDVKKKLFVVNNKWNILDIE